jgi:response regulator of citrate/malate metabolism
VFASLQAKLIILGVAVLLTALGTAWVTYGFCSYQLEAFKAAQFKQAAEDNAKALEQMERHDKVSGMVIEAMGKAVAERNTQVDNLRKAINATPKTRACVDSPAIRTLFDGLRSGTSQRH